MKTVNDLIEQNKGNQTPLHGFKVGDMVKTTHNHDKELGNPRKGEIVEVSGKVVTIESNDKYDLHHFDEFWLMPNDSNDQTR